MAGEFSSATKEKVVRGSFWTLLIISFIFLIIFVFTFWGPISHNLTDWYEYGSFLAFIVSLLNLACFISLTYNASVFQETSHRKQMLVQKIELQTAFRKSHIDDVRKRMLELNDLPTVKMDNENTFRDFLVKCKSLSRIFGIYEENYNPALFGECNYAAINSCFSELNARLEKINKTKSLPTSEDIIFFNDVLGRINNQIIILERTLSEFTFQEVINAFEQEAE